MGEEGGKVDEVSGFGAGGTCDSAEAIMVEEEEGRIEGRRRGGWRRRGRRVRRDKSG